MSDAARWLAGDPALRGALVDALRAPERCGAVLELVRDRPGRRRLARLRLASGETLFLKHYYARGGRHPLRDACKRRLGLDAARREWHWLTRLRAAGVAVPPPRALLELPGEGHVLALAEVPGRPLAAALAAEPRERRALLAALAERVARLHAAGVVHRDLHAGNVWVGADGPLLLDFQSAWPGRGDRARRRDLGELDASLAGRLSRHERVWLAARALGLERPFDPPARRALRAVARASRARAHAHARSRTRRALRPGRRFAALRLGAWRGLRLRSADEAEIAAALAAHDAARPPGSARSRITEAVVGERALVVKEVMRGGGLRRLADLVRGSPARRGWRGGHGLLARRIGAATPLAFVERRCWGVLWASRLVLADVRPARPADRCAPDLAAPEELVETLRRLAVALHARGASHGDLKASHVWLRRAHGRLEATLVDLEDVRFPRRLRERTRVRELAQLNASLGDAVPDALRRRAFARYATALPFRSGRATAMRRIVAASRARQHHWRGDACIPETGATRPDPAPPSTPGAEGQRPRR